MTGFDHALLLAAQIHEGQTDKAGQPYILHPMRVSLQFENEQERIVAILHDVVEDADYVKIGSDRNHLLASIYGVWGIEVGDAVKSISKRKGESLDDYYERVAANPLALKVKIRDVYDNFNRLAGITDPATARRLYDKYAHALSVLEPLGEFS